MTIVWENPPGQPRKVGVWEQRLAPLVERPLTWARVHECTVAAARTTAANLKRTTVLPAGTDRDQWDFVSRATGAGRGAVYARFLGPKA